MPTYAYRCTACEHSFEAQQSFTDDALSVCPECEGRLRKVFSAVGVVFKGSGFYRNDARKGSSAPASGRSGTTGTSGASTSSDTSTSSSSTSNSSSSNTSSSTSSSSSSGSSTGSTSSSAPATTSAAAASV